MKKIYLVLIAFIGVLNGTAQEADTVSVAYSEIEKSMNYQTGTIDLAAGNATLTVPKGFQFLDAKQTQYVLTELWGNPEDTTVLGAILPENGGVTYDDSWMFIINYEDMGYVADDDAADINYDELLEEIQGDMKAESDERVAAGFETVSLVGWASKPYYDDKLKVLHWAKELKFGETETNTLNYDLRVLGRKGVFRISAVSDINSLPDVKKSIPAIVQSVKYKDDFTYADFDSNSDNVAAWTIGGLVAGKVLAKVGFFAIILKFGKFIFFGLVAAFAAFKKFFNKKDNHEVTRPAIAEALPETEIHHEEKL
ncbi:MAG TPA: DUF2167 domain-containing protein [Flavobacterium sp.]|jgi:uncharacterized membrane-anchored protein